ncbi:hypothetical protein CaCOL14_010611 [Colletotrichum acutatum]|uniref:Uncharacterized protein n=1 Tax=Glomerella acutata TaxID=27357 RepID=A0AAD8UPB3_GLOAC|nr:uncharacterized protein BDZ83DRAFT_752103 [Colletotrichum acutatum]KAK1724916.1 hypothetical protein BDZ83DRAFT_752103 [Colletotrichum acutatum]
MNDPSEFDDEEFRTAPSTREHSLSVNRPPTVTQLPGVFVPSCHNGTVIYPTTTQRDPNFGRRPSIVPPGPPTTLDCSLLSNGDIETMTWAPQASPVFRRPSRCMSMDQTRTQAHNHCLPPAAAEAVAKGNLSGNKCLASDSQNSSSRRTTHRSGPDLTSNIYHGPTTTPIRGRRNNSGSHSSINVRYSRHSSRSEHLSDTPRRSGHSIWGKPNTLMQQIMGKVRVRLTSQRRTPGIASNDPDGATLCNKATCQYVLTDDQVQDVVEIVFKEMCKHNKTMEDVIKPQQANNTVVQTKLARKPSFLKTAIELQHARAADTATTISEPETSFFTRSATDGQVRSRSVARPAPITTIVSRDSITDIQWLADTLAEQSNQTREPVSDAFELPTSAVSQTNSSMFNVSRIIEGLNRDSDSDAVSDVPDFHGFSLGSQHVDELNRQKENVKETSVDNEASSITSFPSLPQRHCTSEWLSAPATLIPLEHEDKDKVNMYHLGIDARLGSIASIRKDLPHGDFDHGTTHEVDLPLNDPPSVNTKPSHRGSEALVDLHSPSETKLPGQLPENVRRRSAHFAEPLVQDTRKPEPGFMQQITRKISSVFQSSPSSSRTTRAPAPSEVGDEAIGNAVGELGASRPATGTVGPGVDCLSEPEPDAVYQAMVLSRPTKDKKKRRSTCSEDYIPHTCVDDLSTSGMPSPNIQ